MTRSDTGQGKQNGKLGGRREGVGRGVAGRRHKSFRIIPSCLAQTQPARIARRKLEQGEGKSETRCMARGAPWRGGAGSRALLPARERRCAAHGFWGRTNTHLSACSRKLALAPSSNVYLKIQTHVRKLYFLFGVVVHEECLGVKLVVDVYSTYLRKFFYH